MSLEELVSNGETRQALQKIVTYEEGEVKKYKDNPSIYGGLDQTPWWKWQDIPIHWSVCQKLLLAEVVKALGKHYSLVDREVVKQALEEFKVTEKMRQITPQMLEEMPEDLFSVVVGYEDVKQLFNMSIKGEKQTHILLIGPPASSKSVILLECGRLPGAFYLLGGTTTKVGLIDQLFNLRPHYVLLDEIDKMGKDDFTALLSLMETGIIKETKHGKAREIVLPSNVYAACNRIDNMPPELLSRFQYKLYFKPYTEGQFIEVAIRVLTMREDKTRELAEYIAYKIAKVTRDVRDCVGVARLADSEEEVDFLVQIRKKYGRSNG